MTPNENDLFVHHPYGDLNLLFVRESVVHWLMSVQRVRKLIWLEEKGKVKVKVKYLYLTSVVPSATRLVSMEADGAPFTPLPLSVLRFTGI